MPDGIDALSDQAMGASKLAHATHAEADHKAASAAHQRAFVAAQAGSRPSLAQHHLQAAAEHDKHADPTTPEGKGEAANRASLKARSTGAAADHKAAQAAHEDASKAYEDAGGSSRRAGSHMATAFSHQNAVVRAQRMTTTD